MLILSCWTGTLPASSGKQTAGIALPVSGICISPIALLAGLAPANCGTLDRHEITAFNRAALVTAALGKMILAGCLAVPKGMMTRPHR